MFPGSNREGDAVRALAQASGTEPAHGLAPRDRDPAGRSDPDPRRLFLRRLSALRLDGGPSPVMREVAARAAAGVHVMGICNGYQVLTETGLLPGVLMRNAGLKFICRQVHLKVDTADAAFTSGYAPGQVIRVPVAHNEGNYFADPAPWTGWRTRTGSPSVMPAPTGPSPTRPISTARNVRSPGS